MSTEARTAPSGGRESVESLSPQPYPPHFYPAANYPGPPQPPWFPPGQVPTTGSSGPWPAPWGYPGPVPGWTGAPPVAKTCPTTSSAAAAVTSDEYTVDTMRRIYNDDDGRVEIQRVKVQRRQPEASTAVFPAGPDAMSLVPVGTFPLNERRPPPRKNKLKRQMQLMQSVQGQQQGTQPWYPYMPYMPYPYPYPYYYGGGCVWPPSVPPPPMTPWPGSDDSERTTSRQESLPTTLDSQRLDSRVSASSRNSHSPLSQRSLSPTATTQSIAPSDSMSVWDEDSLKCSIRGPTPPPRTKSRASIERRARAIMAPSDFTSDAGDKSSYSSTSTDIVPYQKLPPKRKNRKSKTVSISDKSSSVDQKDTDSLSDRNSVVSDMTCDESRLSSELNYAFRNFEKSVDVFKTKVSGESTPVNTPPPSPSPIIVHSSDTATPTGGNIYVAPSEHMKSGDDTDTYIQRSDQLEDQQPSTESFSSLPLLETAPLDSLSSTTPKKVSETTISPNVSIACDSKHEEENLDITDVSVSVPESTTITISTTTAAIGVTPTTTKVAEDIQQPSTSTSTSTSTSAQASNSSVTITNAADVSNTSGTPTANAVLSSEQISAQDSQTTTKMKEKVEKECDSTAERQEISRLELDASSGRDSRASSSTFFSIRPSDDPLHFDTDSTDILLPTTDATTADEGGEGTDWTASSPVVEDNESYQWVLQQPGEIPDLACSTADKEDERRNAWRAEVSLWRARLVVSLCRGRGLDRQDWATFHLLVHHPLTLDLKLSMLHASRLCVANSTTGAALVRVALIHLAQHGETLLQPEASRQLGWRSIKVDPNQSWAPVKGAVEILKALGYREREDGVLRYPRRSGPEVSVLARLTLDMLVLAEEFRLYLTGTHQYPTNISDLFFPVSISTPAPLDGSQMAQDLPRPPSSVGSYSFMSAQSSTSLNHRPGSRASSVTDEDTETLQASVRQAKSHSKKAKQTSSSEEEVTLKEDLTGKSPASQEVMAITHELKERAEDKSHPPSSDIPFTNKNVQPPASTIPLPMSSLMDQSCTSLDMLSSLPDLQSIKSSTLSLVSQPLKAPESNGSVTPVATPLPNTEETKDNPEEHIYEEIDVIRQQVQALRASSVPVDSAPPPLPPKKKVSSGGEDDSGLSLTYPHMEWTSTSMPGSLRGGSTGAKRKKRRAPMPPDFMPPDWKPYENRPPESPTNVDQERSGSSKKDYAACQKKTKGDYKRTLNPFYEDIDSVKAQVKELNKASERKAKSPLVEDENKVNPFDQDEYVVSGYIGKNPFYEDIDENSVLESQKRVPHSAGPSPKLGGSNLCAMGSLSELQDESILIKAKRRAPKPPTTPIPSNRSNTPQPPKSPSSPQPPKHPNTPPPKPPSSPHPPKSPSSPQPPKSTSSPQPTKQLSTTPPLSPPSHQQQITDVDKQKVSNEKKPSLIDESSTQGQNTSSKPVPAETANTNQQNSTAADENKVKDPTPCGKDDTSAEKAEARQIVSNAVKASLQRLSLQHPTIPPPPPPPKLEDDEEIPTSIPVDRPLSGTASQNTTQSILDEIPYMDANEVKCENVKASEPNVPPSPQYEIPALPGKDGIPVAPPLSPTTMRQTALLLSGHGHRSMPFIDESDLPPDCPPPPPPTSPPETPKASPPETPHVSPPETPHTSPPATPPCGSPPSSPLTIKQTASTTAAEVPLQEKIKSNSQSTEQTVELTKKDILTAPESDTSADLKSHPSTVPENKLSTTPENKSSTAPENKLSTAPESAPLIGPKTNQLTSQVSDPSTIPESKPSTAPEINQLTALVNDSSTAPESAPLIGPETNQLTSQVSDSSTIPESKPSIAPEINQLTAQVNDSSTAPESNPPIKEKITVILPLTPVQKEVKPNDSEEGSTQGPPLPPKTIQSKYSNLTPQAASSSAEAHTDEPLQSSKSEDKYDPSEGPIHSPVLFGASDEPTTKAGTTEEGAKNSSEATKPQGAASEDDVDEERYEIPEVVKETALSIGPEGMPVRVGGPAQVHRLDMESVFGPPKPPRRRRNLSLPPPRPPKKLSMDDMEVPKLPPKANTAVRPASASTTASFVTAVTSSPTGTPTSLRGTPKIRFPKNRSKTRRSWPLLFCDCMYVNCKNYDDMGQK